MSTVPATPPAAAIPAWGRAQAWFSGRRRTILLLSGLIGYGLFVAWWFQPAASGSDCSGYLHSGRLLASGELTTTLRTVPEYQPVSPWPYTPLGFLGADLSPVLRPTYPPGLPLHYAAVGLLGGWTAGPTVLAALVACACVALCHATLRGVGVSSGASFAGALAFAFSPLLLFVSFIPFSDALATAWCGLALLCALKSGGRTGPALLCGFAVSVAMLVRPTSFLVVPALVLLLGTVRGVLAAAIGGLPGALAAALYNSILFGGALKSGYGPVGHLFTWANVLPSLSNYVSTLAFALPLAFVALATLPFLPWRTQGRAVAGLLVWCGSLFGFYAFYEYTSHVWWYLRFVLPCFGAIAALAMLGVDGAGRRITAAGWPRLAKGLPWLVLAASLVVAVHGTKKHQVLGVGRDQAEVVAVCEWSQRNLPPHALIACRELSGAYYYYTRYPIYRWDVVSPSDFQELERALAHSGRPLYLAILDFAESESRTQLAAKWERVASFRLASVWRYAPLKADAGATDASGQPVSAPAGAP